MKIIELKTITNMKKLTILLAFALVLGGFTACSDEENKLPYIPYEPETPEVPAEGENQTSQTVVYSLKEVLLCDEAHPEGINLMKKVDFFNSFTMTIDQTPTGVMVTVDDSNMPFHVFGVELPNEPIKCKFDLEAVPNQLLTEDGLLLATFDNQGFAASVQFDSDKLTYKYNFKKVE